MEPISDISYKLFTLVKDRDKLINSTQLHNPIVLNTFKEVGEAWLKNSINETHKLMIHSVVDYIHEQLHIGHWSSVPLLTKKAFYASSFLKAVVLLQLDNSAETLREALKCLDLGILLGAPIESDNELLTDAAKCINEKLRVIDVNEIVTERNQKRKRDLNCPKFDVLNGVEVVSRSLPTLELFMKEFYNCQVPVKIQDSINHWPAIHKWPDVTYILGIAGNRTVPIEIGSQYSDENWSQKLMPLSEFVKTYYLGDCDTIGYLAQHNLLDQIPELKNDICIPEYCVTSRDGCDEEATLEINAWFGPKGTISSLHFDPKDNLLAQVYGTKLVILFSPQDTQYLYTHSDQMLCNTSQVNPIKPDLEQFPEFTKAKMMKCLLEAGEMLYIPPKWWHYVVALEKSFSVNFWWT
ncbi:hypoxia-inducible factor 1 alpha inhibitor-related [Holotrichia oblita]|uniref:Hypoxia-inducible factor 1 alpha inhibitor-related n=1 Tax=Holotrichia oblita TaxID=644536 RepID=A0ACB9TXR1_HOLOL|nr:hypoxia-inducible factor 1 alpha inhibitor-related [Holotrichia oblita]